MDDTRPDVAKLRAEAMAKRARLGQLAELLADGTLTAAAVRTASARLNAELTGLRLRWPTAAGPTCSARWWPPKDVRKAWDRLDPERRRAVVAALMVFTLHSPGRGRRTFDTASVEVTPRGVATELTA